MGQRLSQVFCCKRLNTGRALADQSAEVIPLIDLSAAEVAPLIDLSMPDTHKYALLYVDPSKISEPILSFTEYLKSNYADTAELNIFLDHMKTLMDLAMSREEWKILLNLQH